MEICTGLDSHSAAIVVDSCRQVAREQNVAILMTIHQPNSEIFAMMDTCILMHQGRFLYQGDASQMMDYLSAKEMPVPSGYSAPDWAIKVAQTTEKDVLQQRGFFDDNHDASPPLSKDPTMVARPSLADPDISKLSATFERVSLWTETMEIMRRDFRNLYRDLEALKLRILTVLVISVLLAICFWNIGSNSIQNASMFSYHVGAVFLLATATFVALLMVITDSIEQRAIFVREYSAGYYRALPNAVTKIVLDAVILAMFTLAILLITFWSLDLQGHFWKWFCALFLGSMVSNALGHFLVTLPDNAQLVMDLVPIVFAPQTLFCGFIIAVEALPKWIRWYSWLQPLTYLYRILLNDEFSACLIHTQQEKNVLACARAAQAVIDNNGFTELSRLYDDNTVLNQAIAGVHTGYSAIQEYINYIGTERNPGSLGWDLCVVSKTTR